MEPSTLEDQLQKQIISHMKQSSACDQQTILAAQQGLFFGLNTGTAILHLGHIFASELQEKMSKSVSTWVC